MGCDGKGTTAHPASCLSILATRVGCDSREPDVAADGKIFNSRNPHGLRLSATPGCNIANVFNSRNPHGLRLQGKAHPRFARCPFNSRSPYGLRHIQRPVCITACHISILATRVGCDESPIWTRPSFDNFQFSQPVWVATGFG